jgi:hypothetical protein
MDYFEQYYRCAQSLRTYDYSFVLLDVQTYDLRHLSNVHSHCEHTVLDIFWTYAVTVHVTLWIVLGSIINVYSHCANKFVDWFVIYKVCLPCTVSDHGQDGRRRRTGRNHCTVARVFMVWSAHEDQCNPAQAPTSIQERWLGPLQTAWNYERLPTQKPILRPSQ